MAKQELASVTKREPKLHFAISAELKSGADGKNVVDGYKLIVMNYGDALSVLSRHLGAQALGKDHPIFSQVWNGHGQFVEAMCNSIVVMPGEVKPLFTGERTLSRGELSRQFRVTLFRLECVQACRVSVTF